MNIFRITGDISHLVALVVLLVQIWRKMSCAGISGKTQVFYLMVFITRYLDLFTNFISPYNTTLKVLFILLTFATVLSIYVKFNDTYDREHELSYAELLLIPPLVLAFVINHQFSALEISWTFSIYLESIAILPQLYMINKIGRAQAFTIYYLLLLGAYRCLYIFNWAWRYHYEGLYDLIAIVAGCVQTLLYCDFFYLYLTKGNLASFYRDDGKIDITNI